MFALTWNNQRWYKNQHLIYICILPSLKKKKKKVVHSLYYIRYKRVYKLVMVTSPLSLILFYLLNIKKPKIYDILNVVMALTLFSYKGPSWNT